MAVIAATSVQGSGEPEVTITTLGASDTFVFNPARNPVLILNNVTGGSLTPNIDGDGGSSVVCAGVGTIDVSGGYDVASIASGEVVAIPLKSISSFLLGTIAITGGDGIEAAILEA